MLRITVMHATVCGVTYIKLLQVRVAGATHPVATP